MRCDVIGWVGIRSVFTPPRCTPTSQEAAAKRQNGSNFEYVREEGRKASIGAKMAAKGVAWAKGV